MLPTERKPTVRSVRIADMKLSFIRRDALSAKPVERQDADNGLLYNVITKEKKRGTACIEWQFLFLLAFFLLLFPIRKKYLIFVRPIKTKARHGVAPQETVVGANFTIDLKLKTNFIHAAQTDRLEGTVSYADVHTAVKEVMKTPSRLLEHVCERIAERLFHDFPVIEEIDIRLYKENPPMGADCQKVGVAVHYDR